MSTITVDTDCGTTTRFDDHRDARERKRTHVRQCAECTEDDVRITVDPDQTTLRALEDGGNRPASDPEASASGTTGPASDRTPSQLTSDPETSHSTSGSASPSPDDPDPVASDPLEAVPEHVIDVVDGRPTIGARGYAMIAAHLNIAVQAEPVTTAGETDHEYAEFRATAWQKDEGPERGYTGFATATAAEDHERIEHGLNEVAETRAMKRAVAWASGIGLPVREGSIDDVGVE